MFRLFFLLAAVAGITYLGFVLFLYANQYRMLYQPRTDKPEKKDWGAEALQTVSVTTGDGLTLYGWYAPPAGEGLPVIVVFHGNGQHIGTTYKGRMDVFVRNGYGVLMAEYRGYAGHEGLVREEGLYRDARAFLAWLRDRQGLSGCDVVLYGESLGVGVAVQMATEVPARALVLASPFPSFLRMAQDKYPYVPVKYLMKEPYRNDLKIGRISSPLLVLHGELDGIIPVRYGRMLFDMASEPKAFVAYEDGNHVNLFALGAGEKIMNFLSGRTEPCRKSGVRVQNTEIK